MRTRQNDRSYLDKSVERWKLEKLIEAFRLSLSACNSQPWKFILVDDPQLKKDVAKATFSKVISFNTFVPQASVLAVLTLEKPKIIKQIGG